MNPDLEARYAAQFTGEQRANTGKYGGNSSNVGGGAAPATKIVQPSGGGFIDYAGRVVTQTAKLGAQAVGAAARFTANTAVDIVKTGASVVKTYADSQTQPFMLKTANGLNEQLDRKQKELQTAHKEGKISAEDYAERLRGLSAARSEI